MSPKQRVKLVTRREFVQRVRTRAFVLAAIITFAGSFAGVVIPHLMSEHRATVRIGFTGAVPPALQTSVEVVGQGGGRQVRVHRLQSGAAQAALIRRQLDAVIADGTRVIVRANAPSTVVALAQDAVTQTRTQTALLGSAVSRRTLLSLSAPVPVERVGNSQGGDSADRSVAIAALILLYVALMVGGNWVSTAIVEEKASKLVELLVPSVRPVELLAGKVLGVGAVGLCQFAAVVAGAAAGAMSQHTLHLAGAGMEVVVVALAWLLVGYAIYATAFATAAALVSRQEEVAAATAPVTILIALAYAITVATINDTGSRLAHVLSLTPIFAPLLMPMRVAAGGVPAWELAVSLFTAVAVTGLMVRLAAAVYCGAMLADGRRLWLRDALAQARENQRARLALVLGGRDA